MHDAVTDVGEAATLTWPERLTVKPTLVALRLHPFTTLPLTVKVLGAASAGEYAPTLAATNSIPNRTARVIWVSARFTYVLGVSVRVMLPE